MKLLRFILVAGMLTAVPLAAPDEGKKLPTVGLAIPVDRVTDAPFQKALREGLEAAGYVDGKNVRLILRYADGDPKKLSEHIRELVRLKVDVLVGDAFQLKGVTTTIPIVSHTMSDPVRTGLVASLARPGGNITGLSSQRYDIDPKLLELATELLPKLSRLCVLFDDAREPNLEAYAEKEFGSMARERGISICTIPARTVRDIQAVPKAIASERPQAALVWASAFIFQERRMLIGPIAQRVPVIGEGQELAEAGAVVSYSVDWPDMFRRSGAYIAKILNGAKPADLPIEQPRKFKLVVNLKAAKQLNVKVSESILVRADEIIR
ncbi:MAG TPA: ABC transporter substrate-binding protein [Burkholderiales bacterium]|nr:ABC transporter substrate-binding protein [Burkholderiales bacterium]